MTQLNLWCLLYGHVSTPQSFFVVSDRINSCENKNVPLLWNGLNSFVETSLTLSFANNNAYSSVGSDNSNLNENVTTINQHLDYLLSTSSTSHTSIIIWRHRLRHPSSFILSKLVASELKYYDKITYLPSLRGLKNGKESQTAFLRF